MVLTGYCALISSAGVVTREWLKHSAWVTGWHVLISRAINCAFFYTCMLPLGGFFIVYNFKNWTRIRTKHKRTAHAIQVRL